MHRFASLTVLLLVGTSACKDPPSSSAAPAHSAPARGPHAPALPADKPEDLHPHTGPDERALQLDREMAAEPEDPTWAATTVQTLRAIAPQATEITCRTRTCRVVLVTATEKEIFGVADKLRPQADQVIATAPQDQNGQLLARLYLRFER